MYLLFYEYGENALERRAPFREEHLGLASKSHADGQMVLAGAYTDPVDGAILVFRSRDAAEAFVKVDPYVKSGLVTSWKSSRVERGDRGIGGPARQRAPKSYSSSGRTRPGIDCDGASPTRFAPMAR